MCKNTTRDGFSMVAVVVEMKCPYTGKKGHGIEVIPELGSRYRSLGPKWCRSKAAAIALAARINGGVS